MVVEARCCSSNHLSNSHQSVWFLHLDVKSIAFCFGIATLHCVRHDMNDSVFEIFLHLDVKSIAFCFRIATPHCVRHYMNYSVFEIILQQLNQVLWNCAAICSSVPCNQIFSTLIIISGHYCFDFGSDLNEIYALQCASGISDYKVLKYARN